MSHGLSSTDVTKLADKIGYNLIFHKNSDIFTVIFSGGILSTKHPQDDRKRYSDTLNSQVNLTLLYADI